MLVALVFIFSQNILFYPRNFGAGMSLISINLGEPELQGGGAHTRVNPRLATAYLVH